MKKLFLILVLTLLCLTVASMAYAQWVTTQLTDNADDDRHPQINANGHVVWQGKGGSGGGCAALRRQTRRALV